MADIEVQFLLPVGEVLVTAQLDETMTPPEIINELIAGGQIEASPSGYKLAVQGGAEINDQTQLKNVVFKDKRVIRVIAATDAG